MNRLFKLSSSFFAIAFSFQVNAQTVKVSGTITDQNKKSLDYASVALIRLPDSVSFGLQSTNKDGVYEFQSVKPGQYLIKALMVGYRKNQSAAFAITDKPFQVPAILLQDQTTDLKEVNIISKLPVIDQKADRTIVNVEQMNTAGDNALEVISRAPGIRLDKDDNIILKGKSGVNVMIDGKMSYMSGAELTTYLKSLPGSVLSKIELISNPPASFDAAGTAGFINIKLKRNKLQGTNGNANLGGGYGRYEKVYGGINLNYNVGKLSSYVRLNAGHYNSYNRLTLNRTIGNEQFDQLNYWHPITNSLNYSAGADYFVNDKHTVGFMFKGFSSPSQTNVNSSSPNYDRLGVKQGSVDMFNPQDNSSGNHALNFNYRFKIDTAGRELGFDADYVNYKNDKTESFVNTYLDGNDNLKDQPVFLRNNGMGQISIYALKMDYIHPFTKTLKLEAGWKSSWIKSQSDVRFDSLKTAGWINDAKRTNAFNYNENINAGYISLNQTLKNFDFKAGVRVEQTLGDGFSSGTSTVIDRKYWKLFPNVSALYKIDKNNQLTASYRKSINRPSYSSLNPFAFYSDPYTAIQGNPLLQPSYANSFELNYNLKNFRLLTVSYSTRNGSQSNVIYQNDITKESISRPENLNRETGLYLASGSPFDVVKWWNNNTEISVSYNKTSSPVQGSGYNASKWSWGISSDNTFTLPKDYSLNLYGYYEAPSISGLYRNLENYAISIGAKKTFWKKNATISARMNDVFATGKFRAVLAYNNINTYWQNEWENRKVSVNLTYKFGNMKIKTARSRRTGTGDEERRVGN
ncbi:TonB-dependent receptor [Pedobacter chinensis]|uniref:TonB-dependent receptor n=1 Tax=Pedobacter chinensis TaxID=2282421 RepID=A0A369PV32_9SPHI|nr:outer membrane beta-barrel family protein [Pedobacter chinensis]RDC56374.1 TonB-dependent receptor [Pedobacter chinensis]